VPAGSLTATMTATLATANGLRQSSTANYSRTFYLTWASAPPEKQKVDSSILSLTTGLTSQDAFVIRICRRRSVRYGGSVMLQNRNAPRGVALHLVPAAARTPRAEQLERGTEVTVNAIMGFQVMALIWLG